MIDQSNTASPLLDILVKASRGEFLPADGGVTLLSAPGPGLSAVVAFTGHAVVAADIDAKELSELGADGFGGALHPRVLMRIARETGHIGVNDVVLVRNGLGDRPVLPRCMSLNDHPRVCHARALRENVEVFGDARQFVTLGLGLSGRLELGIEIAPEHRGRGAGRALISAALAGIATHQPVFAAVSPGNSRSLRSFLAAGFVPIGSEVIIHHNTKG